MDLPRFVTDGSGGASDGVAGGPSDPSAEALDAYSRVVTRVARDLAPSVANLRC